jgi:hypothetical protein
VWGRGEVGRGGKWERWEEGVRERRWGAREECRVGSDGRGGGVREEWRGGGMREGECVGGRTSGGGWMWEGSEDEWWRGSEGGEC